jgi:hypothetical protein
MITGPNGPDSLLALTKPYNPIIAGRQELS